MKREISLGSGGGLLVRIWRCRQLSLPLGERPQERGGIARAWTTVPEGASEPNGTVICREYGVPDTEFYSVFKLDKCHVQFYHDKRLGKLF